MAKTWEHLTASEKIEDLREDVQKLYSAARQADGSITAFRTQFARIEAKINEMATDIASLKEAAKAK